MLFIFSALSTNFFFSLLIHNIERFLQEKGETIYFNFIYEKFDRKYLLALSKKKKKKKTILLLAQKNTIPTWLGAVN
jgi:arginine utilization protein RocB